MNVPPHTNTPIPTPPPLHYHPTTIVTRTRTRTPTLRSPQKGIVSGLNIRIVWNKIPYI